MLDKAVLEIMNSRLKTGETILWAASSNQKLRDKSEDKTLQSGAWNVFAVIFILGLFLNNGYEAYVAEEYIRMGFVLICVCATIYIILMSLGHLPNPFYKHDHGSQFYHYVVTNRRLRLFKKNINKASEFSISEIDHAHIMYPKQENYLTISFKNDPDEKKMISLNGVKDFSEAVTVINDLVGHDVRA